MQNLVDKGKFRSFNWVFSKVTISGNVILPSGEPFRMDFSMACTTSSSASVFLRWLFNSTSILKNPMEYNKIDKMEIMLCLWTLILAIQSRSSMCMRSASTNNSRTAQGGKLPRRQAKLQNNGLQDVFQLSLDTLRTGWIADQPRDLALTGEKWGSYGGILVMRD